VREDVAVGSRGWLEREPEVVARRCRWERVSANVGIPLGLFVGFALCAVVVALTVAPKRTPESRAGPKSAREVDRRRRVAGAAIGAGLAGIGAGQAFSTPSHPVWVWVLAGVFVWAVPTAALTVVAHWAANVLNRPWADVFWWWDGRRLPDPIGTRGTAIFIGSTVAAFVVVGVTVS